MRKRIEEFDILRGIGAIAVVVIHVTSTYVGFAQTSLRYLIYGTINRFCAFAVPLFLLLSAMQFTYSAFQNGQLSVGTFYKKRLLKTVPVYLLWVAICYQFLEYCNYWPISPFLEPGRFFTEYVLQGKVFYHLYFMPLILQLYLLFPLLYFGAKQCAKLRMNTVCSFLAAFLLLTLGQRLFQNFYQTHIMPTFPNSAVLIATYLLTVGMGIWIGANYEEFRKSRCMKLLALAGAVVSGYFHIQSALYPTGATSALVYPVYTTCGSIVILSAAILIADHGKHIKAVLQNIGKHSFVIYLAHPLILDRVTTAWYPDLRLVGSSFSAVAVFMVIKFVLAFGGAYAISVLISAVKKVLKSLMKK